MRPKAKYIEINKPSGPKESIVSISNIKELCKFFPNSLKTQCLNKECFAKKLLELAEPFATIPDAINLLPTKAELTTTAESYIRPLDFLADNLVKMPPGILLDAPNHRPLCNQLKELSTRLKAAVARIKGQDKKLSPEQLKKLQRDELAIQVILILRNYSVPIKASGSDMGKGSTAYIGTAGKILYFIFKISNMPLSHQTIRDTIARLKANELKYLFTEPQAAELKKHYPEFFG